MASRGSRHTSRTLLSRELYVHAIQREVSKSHAITAVVSCLLGTKWLLILRGWNDFNSRSDNTTTPFIKTHRRDKHLGVLGVSFKGQGILYLIVPNYPMQKGHLTDVSRGWTNGPSIFDDELLFELLLHPIYLVPWPTKYEVIPIVKVP